MATLAHSPSPLLAHGQLRRPGKFNRLVTLWRFVREVLTDTQEMRRAAHRRYPFIGS